ncbi:spermidine/putrescine transport system ATP-binding protein [Modicisalibacter muralis]|uniref:Spermidine/putrescine transport system ATP-binding protein n=1 Tax=Modicisalibacter muralis TaxID=119000 RepID=A0A1G9RP10_9GAMM|nr:ABC transporter ATP-binding protein [Halomonas muralis]SDM24145.1 spermidine/putrescine transport system ATP-binding protein [Halomonas muralis]
MDGSVTLQEVVMRFGDFTAIEPTSLTIESGEFFSFLGPSGCGKTTLLNMISGFLTPSEGRVLIGGEPMTNVSVNQRPTAMIFQNLALFPLMSVYQNIEFGMQVRGVDRATRRNKADELLDLVALTGSGDKSIAALSGGQKQRVAIARALAVEPRVLLLDEPLSALDLKLRQHMRNELKAIQRKTGITFIYITHDQGEALTMSDRVAVMSAGRIQQVADPETLYRHPQTGFVAAFVGENNRLAGQVVERRGELAIIEIDGLGRLAGCAGGDMAVGQSAALFVRPEHLRVVRPGQLDVARPEQPCIAKLESSPQSTLEVEVETLSFEGAWRMLEARLTANGERLRILLGQGADGAVELAPGERVHVGYNPGQARVLVDDGSPRLDTETGEVVEAASPGGVQAQEGDHVSPA